MKKIKIFDVLIISFAILFGLMLFVLSVINISSDKDALCVIKIDGEIIKKVNLNTVTNEEILKIKNAYGENHIRICPEGVTVVYSDCAQKVEMKDTPINKPGQSLVCLPHRLTIEILGDTSSPDAVTY